MAETFVEHNGVFYGLLPDGTMLEKGDLVRASKGLKETAGWKHHGQSGEAGWPGPHYRQVEYKPVQSLRPTQTTLNVNITLKAEEVSLIAKQGFVPRLTAEALAEHLINACKAAVQKVQEQEDRQKLIKQAEKLFLECDELSKQEEGIHSIRVEKKRALAKIRAKLFCTGITND